MSWFVYATEMTVWLCNLHIVLDYSEEKNLTSFGSRNALRLKQRLRYKQHTHERGS